jgi:predicted ATPase/Tfp pilus assembly protein PilF
VIRPYLNINRDVVAFNPEIPFWLDVKIFENITEPSSLAEIKLIEEAVELYRGDFLEGFYVREAEEFEQWVGGQRARLRELVLQALHRLAVYYTRQGEAGYRVAINYLSRLLAMDPWREEAHRQLMLLLAQSGQRSAALEQYKICGKVLAEELGVEPSQETIALFEQIRDRYNPLLNQVMPVSVHLHNFPNQPTSFIGRTAELAEIAKYLEDLGCRLLTLVGPGGIGKTRLAVQTAKEIKSFADGIYFVSLTPVRSLNQLVSTIADILKFSFYGQEDLEKQLLLLLRTKELLLVLDSFEHLRPDGAELLTKILQHTQNVKILVTSRERLNLQAEWIVDIQGLRYPSTGIADADVVENHSAVQLFVQSARRIRADFVLSEPEKPFVVRICELVEGMPLAIELAAAWVRVISPREIAEEIEKNIDFLQTEWPDLSTRHRSLRVVLESSWERLLPSEQEVARKLSFFRGGFSREAAEQVAGASLSFLSSLVDKSLLHRTASARYEMHELLRKYAEAKLQVVLTEKIEIQDHHCTYFATFLKDREQKIPWRGQRKAITEINIDMANMHIAWRWAVTQGRTSEIEKFVKALGLFYEERGRFQEGAEIFRHALIQWESRDEATQMEDPILAKLTLWCAVFLVRVGTPQEAKGLFGKSRSTFDKLNLRDELAYTSLGLAIISGMEGNFEEAEQLLQEALSLYEEVGDQWGIGATLYNLGEVARQQGKDIEAKQHYQASLALAEQGGSHRGKGLGLNRLGIIAEKLEEWDSAKRYYQEGLEIAKEMGDQWVIADALNRLGAVAYMLEEYEESKQWFRDALRAATEIHTNLPIALEVLVGMSRLLAKEGSKESAIEILTFIFYHPSTTKETRDKAKNLLSELEAQISSGLFNMAQLKGRAKSLEGIKVYLLL